MLEDSFLILDVVGPKQSCECLGRVREVGWLNGFLLQHYRGPSNGIRKTKLTTERKLFFGSTVAREFANAVRT
jgi:hypothetical protein